MLKQYQARGYPLDQPLEIADVENFKVEYRIYQFM